MQDGTAATMAANFKADADGCGLHLLCRRIISGSEWRSVLTVLKAWARHWCNTVLAG